MSEARIVDPKKRRFNPIWLLPVIAALLGIFLVVQSYLTEGPEVEITFSTAEGLEAGKTKIKARSVDVGLVETIVLAEDLEHVVVTARLDKSATRLLREDTQFWVVRARIGAGGVSGLGTLLSGGYIELGPGMGAQGRRKFQGLDNQPVTPVGTPGLRLTLNSDAGSSLNAGDPVLFRGYSVGRVESSELDLDTEHMHYKVFIQDEYKGLVTTGTRFWNASGVEMSAGAQGLEVHLASVATLIAGGVAFAVPVGFDAGKPVADGTEFDLYPNESSTLERIYHHSADFVVSFTQSLRGLNPNAPVEYRGIRVGSVEQVLVTDIVHREGAISGTGAALPVLIRLEPGRFGLSDSAEGVEEMKKAIALSVGHGLRMSLGRGNLVTGSLYVAADFYPKEPPAEVGEAYGYPTIPAISGGFEHIEQQIGDILAKINGLPLDATVEDLNATLREATEALAAIRKLATNKGTQQLPERLDGLLEQLSATVEGFSSQSKLYVDLERALQELNRTLRGVQGVTNALEDKPSSLIFSAPHDPDPEPRSSP